MSKYVPENPPLELEAILQRYIISEFIRIGNALDLTEEEIQDAIDLADTNLTAAVATINAAIALKASITYVDAQDAAVITALSASLFGAVKATTFAASGTFTPDAKMLFCEATAFGGGGGGAGAAATGAGTVSGGTGGNGGAKAVLFTNKATIGVSQTVTIGAGGTGVSGADGNVGSATTLGSLLSAAGGEGGNSSPAATAVGPSATAPSQSAVGTIRGWTHPADQSAFSTTSTFFTFGRSGFNELGGSIQETGNANGANANANTGAGGGGCINAQSQAARTGGTGGSGFMIVKEFLSL